MTKVKYILVFALLILAIFIYKLYYKPVVSKSNVDKDFSTKISLNQSSLKEFNLLGQEQKSIIGELVTINNSNTIRVNNAFIYLNNSQAQGNLYNYYLSTNQAVLTPKSIHLPQQSVLFSLDPNSIFSIINMYDANLDLKTNVISSSGPVNMLFNKIRIVAGSFSADLKTKSLLLNNQSASFFTVKAEPSLTNPTHKK